MLLSRIVRGLLAIIMMSIGILHAQEYPSKPVRILCLGPGGNNDIIARLVANGISGSLGQPVIVENRPGYQAHEAVAKAAPDGYNVLISGDNFWISPLIERQTDYDVVRDFSPVVPLVRSVALLVVHPSLQVASVKDLIALAKVRPGVLNFASTTTGGSSWIAGELFNSLAGVKITPVPYKLVAQSITGVVRGEVEMTFAQISTVESQVKSGRLKALAVTSSSPSALYPGLPTVAATVPGYESINFFGIFVPSHTPAGVISRLNQEINSFLSRQETKERFLNTGAEVLGGTPDELAEAIKADVARTGKLIKELNITPQQ